MANPPSLSLLPPSDPCTASKKSLSVRPSVRPSAQSVHGKEIRVQPPGASTAVVASDGGRRRGTGRGGTWKKPAELVSRPFLPTLVRSFVHSLVKEADFLKVSFFHRRGTDGRARRRRRADLAEGGTAEASVLRTLAGIGLCSSRLRLPPSPPPLLLATRRPGSLADRPADRPTERPTHSDGHARSK